LLVEKFVVAHVGEPLEFGRRVQAEARRRGLGEARRSLWWRMVACGFGTSWRIVLPRRRACWIFTTPASTCGTWRTRSIQIMKPGHGRGWSRCCISCGTAAKPGAANLAGLADVVRCNAHRPCPRPWRAKSITSRNIGSISIMRRARRKAVHRQRRDGILVRATPRPVQTGRPVLDGTRPSPPHGPRSRPSQPRLERSLAVKLRTVSRCTPPRGVRQNPSI